MRDFPQAWCQMWNDDASLAGKLATDDFRMWASWSANGDALAGADDLARFVGRYQRDRGVRFTARHVVADEQAQRLAFTWDAAFPDGSVRRGIDVFTLHDGLIAENWTAVGERAASIPDDRGHPDHPGPTARDELRGLCEAWSLMWNGDTARAAEIVTGDFRIWFGA